MLEVGIKGQRETIVTKENTAAGIGSGSLEVFSTPIMILLMEECCLMSVDDKLEEGFTTVGILVNVKLDGRALTFKVEAYDEKGLIGEGIHERFIVNNEKFQAKTDSKLDK